VELGFGEELSPLAERGFDAAIQQSRILARPFCKAETTRPPVSSKSAFRA
jgi:hypothetical protein